MKKTTLTITALALAATTAMAGGHDHIHAKKVDTDVRAVGTQSDIWSEAKAKTIELYPPAKITFTDKKANALNDERLAKRADVQAIHDGKYVTFRLQWSDATYNSVDAKTFSNSEFADGFAMQFPTDYSDPTSLPYIGMGDHKRAVVVHLQKALSGVHEPDGHGDVKMQVNARNANMFEKEWAEFEKSVGAKADKKYQRTFIAKGFRSTTQIKDRSTDFHSNMRWIDGTWYATLTRPLSDEYLNLANTFPVAFGVWDGEMLNRGGIKQIAGWTPVMLEGQDKDARLISEITGISNGDVEKGKAEYMMHCTACHNNGITNNAPYHMAPNLSNIGGYTSLAYIKESIIDTSAVIVPGYNKNQYPNSPWYMLDGEGNRVSTMPNYDWMSDEQIEDIAAYLQTLKREVE